MKSRIANQHDLKVLRELWYESFLAHDSKESIDYYFKNHFDLEHTFILEVDNEIVCALQLNQHQIFYQNEIESVSFVVGVATFQKHRRKGYMKVLLNDAIRYAKEEMKQNYMILQAYDWDVYRSFGFYEAYFKKEVTYKTDELNDIEAAQVINTTSNCLLNIYEEYVKKLDGYKVRDLKYFDNKLKMLEVENVQIINSSDAYLMYNEMDEEISVFECAYINQLELEKLIKVLINKYRKNIRIQLDNLNEKENSIKIIYMMVKDLNKKFTIKDNLYISEEI